MSELPLALKSEDGDRSLDPFSYASRGRTKDLFLYRRILLYQKSAKAARALKPATMAHTLEGKPSGTCCLSTARRSVAFPFRAMLCCETLSNRIPQNAQVELAGVDNQHDGTVLDFFLHGKPSKLSTR